MKKKLRLQVEKLNVEQFEVEPGSPDARGTVHGFETQGPDTCDCGSMGPSDPCRYCVDMPLTWSCDVSPCG
jgi:hypothetical protein